MMGFPPLRIWQRPTITAFALHRSATSPIAPPNAALTPHTQQLTANAVLPARCSGASTPQATSLWARLPASSRRRGRALAWTASCSSAKPSPFASNVVVDRYLNGQQPLSRGSSRDDRRCSRTVEDENADSGDWSQACDQPAAMWICDTVTQSASGIERVRDPESAEPGLAEPRPFRAESLPRWLRSWPQNQGAITTSIIQIFANGPLLPVPAGSLYASAKMGDPESQEDTASQAQRPWPNPCLARNTANARLKLTCP